MPDIKAIYTTVHKDDFPEEMTILLGDEKLVYRKRVWTLDNERKGLRYGENPDQPAALYELRQGSITCGGLTWRGPGQGIVSAMTEAQMLQAGKHPGKTNLTDVDNGANILQYLTERPAAVILKHNNPCGAAWSGDGVAAALEKAFWCDRIAAFGGAVVVNRPLSLQAAEMVAASYFEVVAAPGFEEGAVEVLKKRKNLRIMELPGLGRLEDLTRSAFLDIKSLADGGLVLQKSFVNRILSGTGSFPCGTGRSALCLGGGGGSHVQFRHFCAGRRHPGHRHGRAGQGGLCGTGGAQGPYQVCRYAVFPRMRPFPVRTEAKGCGGRRPGRKTGRCGAAHRCGAGRPGGQCAGIRRLFPLP